VFDGNKAQLFKDTDTQQDAFRKDYIYSTFFPNVSILFGPKEIHVCTMVFIFIDDVNMCIYVAEWCVKPFGDDRELPTHIIKEIIKLQYQEFVLTCIAVVNCKYENLKLGYRKAPTRPYPHLQPSSSVSTNEHTSDFLPCIICLRGIIYSQNYIDTAVKLSKIKYEYFVYYHNSDINSYSIRNGNLTVLLLRCVMCLSVCINIKHIRNPTPLHLLTLV
jgi:hypothetical protein